MHLTISAEVRNLTDHPDERCLVELWLRHPLPHPLGELSGLPERLPAQDHPEYDVMVKGTDQAVAEMTEVAASVNESEARRSW